MRIPWMRIEERPYLDVLALEVVLRDMAAIAEAEGLRGGGGRDLPRGRDPWRHHRARAASGRMTETLDLTIPQLRRGQHRPDCAHCAAGPTGPRPASWRDPVERFWDRIEIDEETGCWLWTGTLQSGGYGQFSVEGRRMRVHRWAYERFIGPIPDDLTIDHLCRVRRCQNPLHLEAVTRGENVLRGSRFDS